MDCYSLLKRFRFFVISAAFPLLAVTATDLQAAKPQPQAITNEAIIKMVGAGLGEDIIITTIQNAADATFNVTVDGLVALKGAGVSDKVIEAMVERDGASPTSSSSSTGREVVIPDGTELKMKLRHAITSASAKVGDRVEFEVSEDVLVNGQVVIKRGGIGRGEVTEAQPKRSFGRSGKLNFTIDAVQAVSGENIRLRSSRQRSGGDSYGKAGVVTILAGPFGALVRGKEVEIPPATEYVIYIDEDRRITLP